MISGKIEKGDGIGTKISFPTINIVIEKDKKLRGVYVCEVRLGGGSRLKSEVAEAVFFGASYVGEKAMLPADKYICEAFLFDSLDKSVAEFGDLHGKFAKVKLLKKIRDVQKTKNLEELKALISEDVNFAKKFIREKL
jgi:riboflavin kinase/FMN adenylyltransferase